MRNGKPPTRYDDEQIETGLATLALCAGSYKLAANRLAENGLRIPWGTLRDWATRSRVERYQELRREKLAVSREIAAQRSEDIASAAAEKEMAFIKSLNPGSMEARDRATALRNLTTTRGISTDVARKLRDEPDTIVEHRYSGQELLARLRRKNPGLVIDSDAEEITEEPKQLEEASSTPRA